MLTWFASRQRRWRDKVPGSDIIHQIEILAVRTICTVHAFSIWAAREFIVLVEQTGGVEANGWRPGPVEISTLVREDGIGLIGVVGYDDGLEAVHLQEGSIIIQCKSDTLYKSL